MKKKILPILFWSIYLLSISSCSHRRSSVLEDNTCFAPCWKQITPGRSSISEVNKILEAMPEIDKDSIQSTTINLNAAYKWDFLSEYIEEWGLVVFVNGIVSDLEFGLADRSITFENVTDKYGEPDEILALYGHGERTYLTIYFFYIAEGIALGRNVHPFDQGSVAMVSEDDTLDVIIFFDPNMREEIMTNGIVDNINPDTYNRGLKLWDGFGEIEYTDR